jgi:hypothetical protein
MRKFIAFALLGLALVAGTATVVTVPTQPAIAGCSGGGNC